MAHVSDDLDPLLFPAAAVTLEEAAESFRAGTGPAPVRPGWGIGDIGYVFLGWLTLSVIASSFVIGARQSGSPAAITAAITLLAVMVPWIAMAGWPILASRLRGNGFRMDYGLRWSWRDIGWGVLYGVAAFATAALLGAVTTRLFGEFTSSAGELGSSLSGSKAVLVAYALAVGVGAPLVEEICFRGLAFSALVKRGIAPVASVAISALIFGMFHLEPTRILLLTGIGLVLGFARWHTGSITTTFVAHVINNAPGAVALLLT